MVLDELFSKYVSWEEGETYEVILSVHTVK